MSTNDHSTDPLTDAELDQLDALNRARTPGRLCVAVSSRGEFGIFGGADGEEWVATLPRGRGAEAEAFVATANALPALLAEVRAARARSPFGLGPESYTLEAASPEMRQRYGAARGGDQVNHTTHVPGSPVQPGERVTIVTTIDADVADLSHHIGRSGVVVHLNYDCGCSQQYPGDPMIGVRLDLDAARTPGEVEEFWAEELGRKAVRVDPGDDGPRLYIPRDLLGGAGGRGIR